MLKDHADFLAALHRHDVQYLIVGGHAVGIHSEPRATKDLDIFIKADTKNSVALFRALAEFGAPLAGITPEDFIADTSALYQVGVPPGRIDLLFQIDGVSFDSAWGHRVDATLLNDTPVHFISKDDLIRNKTASGRLQDRADVEKLQESCGNGGAQ